MNHTRLSHHDWLTHGHRLLINDHWFLFQYLLLRLLHLLLILVIIHNRLLLLLHHLLLLHLLLLHLLLLHLWLLLHHRLLLHHLLLLHLLLLLHHRLLLLLLLIIIIHEGASELEAESEGASSILLLVSEIECQIFDLALDDALDSHRCLTDNLVFFRLTRYILIKHQDLHLYRPNVHSLIDLKLHGLSLPERCFMTIFVRQRAFSLLTDLNLAERIHLLNQSRVVIQVALQARNDQSSYTRHDIILYVYI